MAQVMECLPSKFKSLSSNHSTETHTHTYTHTPSCCVLCKNRKKNTFLAYLLQYPTLMSILRWGGESKYFFMISQHSTWYVWHCMYVERVFLTHQASFHWTSTVCHIILSTWKNIRPRGYGFCHIRLTLVRWQEVPTFDLCFWLTGYKSILPWLPFWAWLIATVVHKTRRNTYIYWLL
jgi:hypothetical protein